MDERKIPETIAISADSSDLRNALSEFDLYVPRLPADVSRKLTIHPSNLVSIEQCPATVGQTVAIHIKPSDWFIDLIAACRNGNFEKISVERKPDCQDENLRIEVKVLMVRRGLDKKGSISLLAKMLSEKTGRTINPNTLIMALTGYRSTQAYRLLLRDLNELLRDQPVN